MQRKKMGSLGLTTQAKSTLHGQDQGRVETCPLFVSTLQPYPLSPAFDCAQQAVRDHVSKRLANSYMNKYHSGGVLTDGGNGILDSGSSIHDG
jgi:hypothetical protein